MYTFAGRFHGPKPIQKCGADSGKLRSLSHTPFSKAVRSHDCMSGFAGVFGVFLREIQKVIFPFSSERCALFTRVGALAELHTTPNRSTSLERAIAIDLAHLSLSAESVRASMRCLYLKFNEKCNSLTFQRNTFEVKLCNSLSSKTFEFFRLPIVC